MSTQLYPEVLDVSAVVAKPTSPIFLPVGAEGQMDNDGTATVGTIYAINTISDAVTAFGATASLTKILAAVLSGGAAPVLAVASKKGSTPLLTDRQLVWDDLSSEKTVRVRITDSVVQADLAALADSCEQAESVQNKQFMLGGLSAGTSKANLITAAGAIASKRGVLVAPAVYDRNGVIQNGAYAAACVAAEVAKNDDPSNDLDQWTVPFLTGIEKASTGYGVFRHKIASGVAVNDFEDLLQGGVSPLEPSITPGGVQISHLRTTYTTDTSFDALSTRVIADQVFVDIRDYILNGGFLRAGNTETVRLRIASGVDALLKQRQDWVAPILQSDGTLGYEVAVTSSNNGKQLIVSYAGNVVRGIQTIAVGGTLSIAV